MAERRVGIQAAQEARDCYAEGRNCAESVLSSLSGCPNVPELPSGIGSGFTSGIGRTGCVCGALAAGVIALSAFVDAEGLEPVAQRERAEEFSAEFTRRFKERWGSTCCRVINRGMTEGSNESVAHCASITEFSAGLVAEMIAEAQPAKRAWALRDVMGAARRGVLDVLAGAAVGLAVSMLVSAGAAAAATLAGCVIGLAVAAIAEFGGPGVRRTGRYVRVAGATAAALIGLAAAVEPGRTTALAEGLLGVESGWAATVARALVAVAALVVAGVSAYEYRRFR